METAKIFPDYGISASAYSDYMVIISPPDDVEEIVRKCKEFCERKVGQFDSRYSRAHISVAGQARQMPITMGQKLDCYQRSLIRLKPVELHIRNFDKFDNGKAGFTIYAKIELNDDVKKWFGQLSKVFGNRESVTPHITIAKTLPDSAFKKLWKTFDTLEYRRAFVPDKLTVLSRPCFSPGRVHWTHFKELYFSK